MHDHDDIPHIAILVTTTNEWGRRLVKGILSYANEVGPWHIWVKPEAPEMHTHIPENWKGDGIIAQVVTQSLADDITRSNIPTINVSDSPNEMVSAPCVRTDDRVATQLAVQHFLDRGIRNFAFAGPTLQANPAWYGRAFHEELSAHGHVCRDYQFREGDSHQNAELKKWIRSLPKPVGVLAWGHLYAREVVDSCLEANISVPHDVAVLSGDHDELLCHACFPALSGILTPTEQIGYKAAQLLHAKLQGENVPNRTHYLAPRSIAEHLSTDTVAIDDPQLIKVVRYLRKHALESITIEDVLKAVPMARRSLERRFRKAFGRSPIEEIRRLRINKARALLTETDLPMQHIAEACGYATYNYLTHIFKRITGSTPRDYRKQFRI